MKPITRLELFLAAAAGEYDGELPEALTRAEQYLLKIIERIDAGSSVSPEEIDAAIEAYLNLHDANIVTEAELANALEEKSDSDHTHDGRYYTEAEVDTLLTQKAPSSHAHDDRYYTEEEIDQKLGLKANAADIPDVSAFITRLVNDLVNYYTKSETYSQAEVNALVSAIPKFTIQVVSSLPSQDISNATVYLVPDANSSSPNLYTEYIYANNNWEMLGTQTVDLSGYYTSAQVDALLNGLSVAGHTHDDRYYTETEIDGKIQTINTDLAGKAPNGHTHDVATTSAAGLMSPEDKRKLDGLNIVVLTQAEYDALDPPDSSTLYLIPEASA